MKNSELMFANGAVELSAPKRVWDFKTAVDSKKYSEESSFDKNKRRILFFVLGAVIGTINGFFGAGGGMLAVPVLGFVGKLDERRSHATAILVMLPLCVSSAVVYAASKALDIGVLIPTCIGVFAGGIIGAKLLKFIPETLLFLIFNSLIFMSGLKMLL